MSPPHRSPQLRFCVTPFFEIGKYYTYRYILRTRSCLLNQCSIENNRGGLRAYPNEPSSNDHGLVQSVRLRSSSTDGARTAIEQTERRGQGRGGRRRRGRAVVPILLLIFGSVLLQFWSHPFLKVSCFTSEEQSQKAVDFNEIIPARHSDNTTFIDNKTDGNDNNDSTAVSRAKTTSSPLSQRMTEWLEQENRPLPPETPGAHIHIGKAGGSTISSQLRIGCHSWLPKPCPGKHKIPNETRISQLTTYYHTPDFSKETIRTQEYQFYVIQIRDPLARFRSIFSLYHHDNTPYRQDIDKQYRVGKKNQQTLPWKQEQQEQRPTRIRRTTPQTLHHVPRFQE